MSDHIEQATRAMDIAIELGASAAARFHWRHQGRIPEIWRLRIRLAAEQRGEDVPIAAMERLPAGVSVNGSAGDRPPGWKRGRSRKAMAAE